MARKTRRPRRKGAAVQRRSLPGASPGTILTDPEALRPVIHVIAYSEDRIVEKSITQVEAVGEFLAHWPVVWINVDGLGDAATIEKLGQLFDLHRLAQEDVVNVHQRAKVEQYADHLFIVAREPQLVEGRAASEQISLFLGKNWVLTFQERPGDSFDPVRERIRKKRGRIRSVGPDYLAYALLDAIVDRYFPALEHYSEQLDLVEEELLQSPTHGAIGRIHEIRGDLLLLRRGVWPQREALALLARDEHPLIAHDTRIYFRDCYDHTIQIIDLLEADRDMCSDMRDFYLSTISNRLNEVMKVLTIIATIFIPLSFIAGVYGMNFEKSHWNMPELRWAYGYPAALGLMAAIAAAMLYYFYRKGWLSD